MIWPHRLGRSKPNGGGGGERPGAAFPGRGASGVADILQEGTGLQSFLCQPVQGPLEFTKLLPRGLHTHCYVDNSTKMRSAFFTLVRMCVQRGFPGTPTLRTAGLCVLGLKDFSVFISSVVNIFCLLKYS